MDFILSFSIIGVSASILLGILFLSRGKGNLVSNRFLGIFFLLIAIRLSKLFAQEYAPAFILDVFFNLMQAAFLAIGPVIWFYVRTYLSPAFFPQSNKFIHFIPSLIALIGAFFLRQMSGEFIWNFIYWGIQIHPLLYVFGTIKTLMQDPDSKDLTANQTIWLYSLLAAVSFIVFMNILYFTLNFPFYLVTALLLIITVYLICFLAFNNKTNVLIGKSDQKYKNLNLDSEQTDQFQEKIERLILKQKLYLNDQLRLSDVSDKLDIPAHVISRVINEISGKSFPQYINDLRIERAKKKLVEESNKKVIAIAFESGFRSLSAFNRVFKKSCGINPSEYRIKYSSKKAPNL